MDRLLDTFDDWARSHPRDGRCRSAGTLRAHPSPGLVTLASRSGSGEIRSIIWATGFHPDYSWLDVPVIDRKGHLRHDGGVVDAPGLYAIGLPCSGGASPRSFTAPRTTRATSSSTSLAISPTPEPRALGPAEAGHYDPFRYSGDYDRLSSFWYVVSGFSRTQPKGESRGA